MTWAVTWHMTTSVKRSERADLGDWRSERSDFRMAYGDRCSKSADPRMPGVVDVRTVA